MAQPAPSQTEKKGGPRPKHIPLRTCVACRTTSAKRELIRIVRVAEGSAQVDPTGKKSGRGAYLCPNRRCWEIGLQKERLDRVLHTKLSQESRSLLSDYGKGLPMEQK